jgi:hypothetical protein
MLFPTGLHLGERSVVDGNRSLSGSLASRNTMQAEKEGDTLNIVHPTLTVSLAQGRFKQTRPTENRALAQRTILSPS